MTPALGLCFQNLANTAATDAIAGRALSITRISLFILLLNSPRGVQRRATCDYDQHECNHAGKGDRVTLDSLDFSLAIDNRNLLDADFATQVCEP